MSAEQKEVVSWQRFHAQCFELAKKVKDSGFRPSKIVAIARGGLIPAVLISHALKNKELYVIRCDYYESDAHGEQKLPRPVIHQKLPFSLEGEKVLLVDEVADSGASLEESLNHLKSLNPKEVKVAAVFVKPKCTVKPDFFSRETDKWVVFPWEQ